MELEKTGKTPEEIEGAIRGVTKGEFMSAIDKMRELVKGDKEKEDTREEK